MQKNNSEFARQEHRKEASPTKQTCSKLEANLLHINPLLQDMIFLFFHKPLKGLATKERKEVKEKKHLHPTSRNLKQLTEVTCYSSKSP